MNPPDFSRYSDAELSESLSTIDREAHPDNWDLLVAELARRGRTPEGLAREAQEAFEARQRKEEEAMGLTAGRRDEEGNYVPNTASPGLMLRHVLMSAALLGYGVLGLMRNDLHIPGRRRSLGIHLHDGAARAAFFALMLFVLYLLSFILDHFDRRDNELKYRRAREVLLWLSLILFVTTALVGGFRRP